MPPKKNKLVKSSSGSLTKPEKEKEEIKEEKQRFKRNMDELVPVLESFIDDLDEYKSIVASQLMDPVKFKNEVMLQKRVVKKMEEAMDALQEATALTHFKDGSDEDGARKKKKKASD